MSAEKRQHLFSLLLITVYSSLVYLIFIPFLGFYNDDWLFGYIGHFYGPKGLIDGFAGDRPLVGYLFALNHLLLNNNIVLWHIYMFLVRLVGGYFLFFSLKKIWPKQLTVATFITLLFLIYPGFLQQVAPLGYQNYITALTIWIASLFFTIIALKSKKKSTFVFFTLTSLTLQLISFLLIEFFIGAEILRLLLILHISSPMLTKLNFNQIKKKIKNLSPYIISLLFFITWRIFVFKGLREATDIGWITQNYYSNLFWIIKIPLKILYSSISTLILAYFIPFMVRVSRLPLEYSIISTFIGIVCILPLYIYQKVLEKSMNKEDLNNISITRTLGRKLLSVGTISIFAAITPIIISGRFVSVLSNNDFYDRYTISSIVSVGFVVIGFLLYKASVSLRKCIMLFIIISSVTTHLLNGYWYKIYWDQQKDIWWQLYWRAPNIQKNAMLIFDFPKVDESISKDVALKLYRTLRLEDYQIWAPGNLFFNYDNLPSNHFYGQYLPTEGVIQKISNKVIETVTHESSKIKYTKDFNNVILISLPSNNSCLWVIDRERQELPNHSSDLLKFNMVYSNIDLLHQRYPVFTPPSKIFGLEPSKNWCYYFQKASLARQLEDWGRLNQLTQEVFEKNLKPKDINEWLPFVEGLIVSRKYSQAENLIRKMSENDLKKIMNNLCKMIGRFENIEFKKYCDKKNLL